MSEETTQAPPAPGPETTKEVVQPTRKKAAARKSTAKKELKNGDLIKIKSKTRNKFHPYQKVTITQTEWITLPYDNWIKVQLEAGVLEKA